MNDNGDNENHEQVQEQPDRSHPTVGDDDDDEEGCGYVRDGLIRLNTNDDDDYGNDDDNNNNLNSHDNSHTNNTEPSSASTPMIRFLTRPCLLPDDRFSITIRNGRPIQFLDGEFAVKLVKFVVFTYAGIAGWYWIVRTIGWEHDSNLKLIDIYTYESTLIILDIVVFYLVGRLYTKSGVDNLLWIVTVLIANWYSSIITDFKMFQHSFTLYEMHCTWPYTLWIFVFCMVPLLSSIVWVHLYYTYQQQLLVQKSIEMLLCLMFTFVPYVNSPYFHLHHWFAGWLVGMHFNYNPIWSQIPMAWCWGCYINGIAVYGRDPVLTCGYALFISEDQRCPFIQCYTQAVFEHTHNITSNNTQKPMDVPDWRNCSSTYKP